jgi:hypothetical protein
MGILLRQKVQSVPALARTPANPREVTVKRNASQQSELAVAFVGIGHKAPSRFHHRRERRFIAARSTKPTNDQIRSILAAWLHLIRTS